MYKNKYSWLLRFHIYNSRMFDATRQYEKIILK